MARGIGEALVSVDDGGSVQSAIASLRQLATMLGSSREANLIVSQRSHDILFAQQEQGRDVLTWLDEEAAAALRIAEVHVARARDAGGNVRSGDAAAQAMWQEIGEYYRDRIASKINDRVNVPKRALSAAYAVEKARKWGAGKPILVASGDLRDDVKLATVEVTRR